MRVRQRQQGLALPNDFDHRTLSYCVLIGDASVIQQTGGVDRPLLGVRAQFLLPERFVGQFVWRVPVNFGMIWAESVSFCW